MTTIKRFSIALLILHVMQACADKTENLTAKKNTTTIDTLTIGCLVTYDKNPLDSTEKINMVFGKDRIKDGHWITFDFAVTKTSDNTTKRIKLEEGYYRKNKKEGYWKFFKDDGTLKDSVEYKHNVPVTDKL